MSFARGSAHALRYIKETEFGVTPDNPDMMALRNTSVSLALAKDTFQSNEIRSDAQISDLRHGVQQAGGDIGIELSYAAFDDMIAAAVRGTWQDNALKAGVDTPYFSFERVFSDIGQYQLFTGCAVNSLSLDIQPNAMVTGSINLVGRGANFSDRPACVNQIPAPNYPVFDGFSGELRESGIVNAVITSMSLSIENSIEAAHVIGSDKAAALIAGRINVSGSVSAYFENMDMLNKFVNEVESEIEITLGSGGPGSYVIKLPRVKYTGGSNPADGEGAIMLDMPFQALYDECAGSNIVIERIPLAEAVAEPCSLAFSAARLQEDAANDGSFTEKITVTLSGGNGKKFSGRDGAPIPGVVFAAVPKGLTAYAIRASDTQCEIELAGNAISHEAADNANISVSFPASAFHKGFCNCEGGAVSNDRQEIELVFSDQPVEP